MDQMGLLIEMALILGFILIFLDIANYSSQVSEQAGISMTELKLVEITVGVVESVGGCGP